MIISEIEAPHFMVLPTAGFKSPSEQNYSISLSGIAKIPPVFYGGLDDWKRETMTIDPITLQMRKVTNRIASLLPPWPMDGNYTYEFVPIQWTVYANFNSIYSPLAINHQGDIADNWKVIRKPIIPIATDTSVNILTKLSVDLSVRSGYIFKVGYMVNMYGYFVICKVPDID